MAMCYGVVSFILFVYLKHCMSRGTCSGIRRVESNFSVFYFIHHFCCDNFEAQEFGCRECRTGFTSEAGSRCKPCPVKSYGRKCGNKCECQEGERCDHEHGCVKLDNETVTIDRSDLNTVASCCIPTDKPGSFWFTFFLTEAATVIHYLYTFPHLTISPVNKTGSNISKVDHVDVGGSKDCSANAIPSYGIWCGSLIIVAALIVLIIFILMRYRLSMNKVRLNSIRSNIQLTQNSNVSNTIEDQQATSEEGHDYDEIDESDVLRLPITSSIASSSSTNSSNDNSVTGGTDNDGYLHSYHSLYSSDIIHEEYTKRESVKTEKVTPKERVGSTIPLPFTVIAVRAYTAKHQNELSFEQEDKFDVIDFESERWLIGEIEGSKGLFPSEYVKKCSFGIDNTVSTTKHAKDQGIAEEDFPYNVIAIHSFQSKHDTEISFNKDDKFDVVSKISDHFLIGEIHGERGIFPSAYVKKCNFGIFKRKSDADENRRSERKITSELPFSVIAVKSYQAETNDELTFSREQKITVIRQETEQWFIGEINGKRGMFPSECVARVNLY